MFKDNLTHLRKMKKMTQEGVAEKLGVTRQAVAKWESGETLPDLEKCRLLAELFGVVTVGEKGQIVIPAKARKVFDISAGDRLVILGDEEQGLAIIKSERFLELAEVAKELLK